MYKLIALDMDGTLLNSKKNISRRTKEAIENARKNGVKVVLATGRPVDGIESYLKELQMISDKDYAITYNGALVQNVGTKDVISSTPLNKSNLIELYNISKELNVNIHAFTEDKCITPKMSKYTKLESEINGIEVDVIDFNTVNDDETILKIMMIDEPEILDAAIKKLDKELYSRYTIVKSTPYFLEFLSIEANKGQGIKGLAEELKINKDEVICIGDAGNDLHMIQYAGLGVAMGNAFEEIKKEADYITKSNDEDGVAHVIEKFVLNKVKEA